MNDKREIRGVQMRASVNEESRKVEGYALVFDKESNLIYGDFVEKIARSALDGVLEKSDVLCLMNHDQRRGVLARYKGESMGSLSLTIDETGLKYSFDAPKTALGDELIESLKRGDISESSFAFSVEKDTWEKRQDGTYVRTILQFGKIYDVSPVYYPAYEDTNVALRSIEAMKSADDASAKEESKREINEYLMNLEKRF